LRCPGKHLLHSPQVPVKEFPLFLVERGGIKGRSQNWHTQIACRCRHLGLRFWKECVRKRIRNKRRRIRREQGQRKFAIKGKPL